MEAVTGVGGVFWRADDPKGLAEWYRTRLGIGGGADGTPWEQQAGPTVFEPFPRDTTYFARPEQAAMFNFRVRDLNAMVAQLRGLGESVTVDPEPYPYGRFARVIDPAGDAVELWQPAETAVGGATA